MGPHAAPRKFGKRNWQTRAIDPAGSLRVLERYVDSVTLLPEHKVNDVQLLALASLDAITKGHGTAEHIGAISLACNMTGALIRQGIGEDDGDCRALPNGATQRG